MTEVTQLLDKELSEAINFHRRQRNLSRGVNEAHHMRQTQMVRMLEAEEARRLEEASDLRVTKVYNKFPKKATYAVHNADRSYHKEFDSMEAAQAHKAEKSKL